MDSPQKMMVRMVVVTFCGRKYLRFRVVIVQVVYCAITYYIVYVIVCRCLECKSSTKC